MSVAHLTAQELGTLAAINHERTGEPIYKTALLLEDASRANAEAFHSQYGEFVECHTAELIAAQAQVSDTVRDHFGPVAYNLIDNEGNCFGADGLIEQVEAIEQPAYKWQEGKRHELERQEQDLQAFNEVSAQPKLASEVIVGKCKSAGCQRVIVAEYRCDESDLQSDYWGGRTSRRIVIGFGKGKRENFKQLRKAAGQFPPTSGYGPGCDRWIPRVVILDNFVSNGAAHWKGSYSHWHSELYDQHTPQAFSTEAEASAFVTEKGEPGSVVFRNGDESTEVRFGWELCHESLENRENYSMGGGNYLGRSRYSGWQVSSVLVEHLSEDCEYFDPKVREQKPRYRLTDNGLVPL